ncbi:hypothetical protein K3495_g896 [Podosphaera aphanis]|nr:hypothetical protein K3495_g896 [Podosphaera aphanis]
MQGVPGQEPGMIEILSQIKDQLENCQIQQAKDRQVIMRLSDALAKTSLTVNRLREERIGRNRSINDNLPRKWERAEDIDDNDSEEGYHSRREPRNQLPSINSTIEIRKANVSRVPDLSEKLEDGKNPTFDAWEIMLENNLTTYSFRWSTERARMSYIFAQTKGSAQSHLTHRMKSSHPQRFIDSKEMLEWLEGFYRDPNERESARIEYNKLRMRPNETFNHFYSRFSGLVSKARIVPKDTLHDLFHKLSPELHRTAIDLMSSNPPLREALRRLQSYDNELRLNREITSEFSRRTTNSVNNNARLFSPGVSSTVKHGFKNVESEERSKTNIKCYNCGDIGHLSINCPKPASAATARKNASRTLAQVEELEEEEQGEDQDTIEEIIEGSEAEN